MDMVGTAADPSFDFTATPITLVVEGDWVRANGTSLGADDGIGEAAILALLGAAADEAAGPVAPLVGLFTVDEETSLSGEHPQVLPALRGPRSCSLHDALTCHARTAEVPRSAPLLRAAGAGAWGVNASLLAGARSLVNLDSEVLGQVIVGSAGACDFVRSSMQ